MASVVRGMVEGIGVTPIDKFPESSFFFTELSIPEIVELPQGHPGIEQLLSVVVEVDTVSKRLIKTLAATSYEGQHLAGRKLMLELKLKQKIRYIADNPAQSVHSAYFEKDVCNVFVVLPAEFYSIPIEDLLENNMLAATPYIEDIYAERLDKRRLLKNITLFIDVQINIRTV